MKLKLLASILVTLLLVLTSLLHAGGSVELSEIQPLLDQKPALWKVFTQSLDISPEGVGLRLGSEGIPLRGYRVGPYEFLAKIKGSSGKYDLKLTINTVLYFLNDKGKEVTDEKLATKKEEVLESITVSLLNTPVRDGNFVQTAK